MRKLVNKIGVSLGMAFSCACCLLSGGCGTTANLSGLSASVNVAQKGIVAGLTLAGGTNGVTVGATYQNGTNNAVGGTVVIP
jgi:hypothetical protein